MRLWKGLQEVVEGPDPSVAFCVVRRLGRKGLKADPLPPGVPVPSPGLRPASPETAPLIGVNCRLQEGTLKGPLTVSAGQVICKSQPRRLQGEPEAGSPGACRGALGGFFSASSDLGCNQVLIGPTSVTWLPGVGVGEHVLCPAQEGQGQTWSVWERTLEAWRRVISVHPKHSCLH